MSYGKKKRKKGPKPKTHVKNPSEEDNPNKKDLFIEGPEIDFGSTIGIDFEDDSPPPPDNMEEEDWQNGKENDFDPPEAPEGDTNEPLVAEPPPISKVEVELEYSSDRSYLYIFGPSTTGKTVLISSILYYLQNNRSIEYGDSLINENKDYKKHEKEGNRLWNELNTTIFENKFPKGTVPVKNHDDIPRHINARLETTNEKIRNFKFCFIDMAGEDLSKVDHDSNGKLPDIIEAYVESLPKENICFTYILDPKSDFLSKSKQLNIFKGFIDLLDYNDHTSTPLLLLVSKWDLVKDSYSHVEDYIKKEFRPLWGILNQASRQISIAEFSIGEVNQEKQLIKNYNYKYAEKVFNWFYKNQTGDSLVPDLKKKKKRSLRNPFKK